MKRPLILTTVFSLAGLVLLQPFMVEAAYYSFGDPNRQLLPVAGEAVSGHTVYYTETVASVPTVRMASGYSSALPKTSSTSSKNVTVASVPRTYTPAPVVRPTVTPTSKPYPSPSIQPSPTTQPTATPTPEVVRCTTDRTLSSFAKQNVSAAANRLRPAMELESFREYPNQIKSNIDDTAMRTGGKMRDIYVGGASIRDKQGMVEEFFRSRLAGLIQSVEQDVEGKAEELAGIAQQELNRPAPITINQRGRGSASQSVSSKTTQAERSGSFKLQQRNGIGLFEDVGRFQYRVISRGQVSVQSLRYSQEYDACDNQLSGLIELSARVKVVPVIQVRYEFTHLGGSRARSRYRTFSGSFYIIESIQQSERDLEISQPIL